MITYALSSYRGALAPFVLLLGSGCASARAPTTQCPEPAGVAVRYEVLSSELGPDPVGSDPGGAKDVPTSEDPFPQAPPSDSKPAPDLSKVRVVEASFHERPGAHVTWVVEAADAVIIGVAVSSYCGGVTPETPRIRVALPVSSKPVRWETCYVGSGCSGSPAP